MARDLNRYLQPSQPPHDDYLESYLPPEVAAYLERSRRRPYVMRGLLAGSLMALAGLWIILEARRRRHTEASRLPDVLPSTV
jgi:hypothetical protein